MPLDIIPPGAVATINALLGAVVGAMLVHRYILSRDRLEMKRDVLRRYMGHRWHLTPRHRQNQEPFFTALNEVPVVFAGDEEVYTALNKFIKSTAGASRNDDIANLAKAMAKSAKVPGKGLTEDLIRIPFIPNFPDPVHVKIPPQISERVAAEAKRRGVQQRS